MRSTWKCALLLAGCGGGASVDGGAHDAAGSAYSDGFGPIYNVDSDDPGQLLRSVSLATPAPWTSLVAPSTPLVFSVYTNHQPSWDALQASVHVTTRPTGEAVPGTYTHAANQFSGQDLTFTPASALPDLADVRITFDTCPTCAIIDGRATGLSTGSHPRVVRLYAASKSDPSYYATMGLSFSEPMNVDSVRAALSLDAGGPVPFTLSSNDQRQMTITLNVPVATTKFFTVTLGACTGASGVALDPASWDAATETPAHTFSLTLDSTTAGAYGCGTGCFEWQPRVNMP